ncbi:MAG: CDP-alcohol phosphatidyltransferase family protein [Candidatus Nanoarchaeia archaeon]
MIDRFDFRFYNKTVEVRKVLFRPLVKLLAWLGISPNAVTFFGVTMMFFFVLFIRKDPYTALMFGILSIFADMTDGILARYLKQDSDRGKFIDIVADNISFTLFIIGIAYAGMLDAFLAIILVYTMVMSKVFRIIVHSLSFKSDWHFKAWGGTIPNIVVAAFFILFPFLLITGMNYFQVAANVSILVLIVDAIAFYRKILRKM